MSGRGSARVGCSGWSYRDWRGLVYPGDLTPRRWFGYYTLLFDTVELNNTFYRLPTRSAVESWAAQAPPDFVYALRPDTQSPVADIGACTGFDSGEPYWRNTMLSSTIAATARNSDCQFWSDSNQNCDRFM